MTTWTRTLAYCLAAACTLAAAGCGESRSTTAGADGIRTADPAKAFAPLVLIAADEPWRPTSAHRFLERAVLWFAEDQGCADRKIAVGRTLAEQRTARVDWIFPVGLGAGDSPYHRNPYDARCVLDLDLRFSADQLTRPHDEGPRPPGLRPGEGFYLDLADAARPGPDTLGATPVYHERADEGDGQVRLAYWMLFGMSGPLRGRPGSGHEGDWERVDVLLGHDGGDRYEPRSVQLRAGTATREVAWDALTREGGHPVVEAARGNHALTPAARGVGCPGCSPWATWQTLVPARTQPWYGFGGAWGEVGPTDATTGPLGPHGYWPADGE